MKHLSVFASHFLVLAAGALIGGMNVATAAHAQPLLTVRQALSQCPDFVAARACPAVAAAFLANRASGLKSDAQIANLALALADAVEQPKVKLRVCRNTADGLRVLAGGMSITKKARQIVRLANDLCDGHSASVPRLGPPASISSGGFRKKVGGDNAADTIADDDQLREVKCLLSGTCP